MAVASVIQHAGAALGGINEEQERQAEQAEALGGLLDRDTRGGLCADSHRQLKRTQLIPISRRYQCYEITRRTGAVDHTGAARAFLVEQVKVVVEQVHLERGLV